uniref:RNase H type-1 domain-containing protein n=1 Tax=Fagus sylvatica TaxID=28930 RepID=A0A2N9GE78_FAGSY
MWKKAGPPHHPVVHGELSSGPQQTQSPKKRSAAAPAAANDEGSDEEDEARLKRLRNLPWPTKSLPSEAGNDEKPAGYFLYPLVTVDLSTNQSTAAPAGTKRIIKGANTARAPELCCWKCLPSGAIKLNIDAAVARDSTSLAVVARDDHGQALQLADSEKFRRIIVEEDVKVCFDALNGDPCNTNWREANEVAHSLAKFVPTSKSSYFSWNVSSLPKAA